MMTTDNESWWSRLVDVRTVEVRALAVAFVYHFVTLASFYVLRPLREAIGAANADILERLYTGTFVVMLVAVAAYGWMVSRMSRRRFVPLVYHLVAGITLLVALGMEWTGGPALLVTEYAIYVWVSVYNLLVVSVFWSVMVDRFDREQARRLFGFVAVGGTLGAIAGSSATVFLAPRIDVALLPLISIVLVEAAALCASRLERIETGRAEPTVDRAGRAVIGGGMYDGMGAVARSPYLAAVAIYVLLLTMTSTFLYFTQAEVVRDAFATAAERTAFFARLNLSVNVVTVVLQLGVTAALLKRLGVGVTLAAMPLVAIGGFVALALSVRRGADPTVPVATVVTTLFVVQTAVRSTRYAFARPAREVLFTVVDRASKYKAKSFIDTAIYRGGDVGFGWLFRVLATGLGWSVPLILVVAVAPLTAWLGLSAWLGRRVRRRDSG